MTQDELKRLLAEQSKTLVDAMIATNQPIERRLDGVNAHLKELNGKVAAHAVALGKGGERMDGFKEDIERIDRRLYDRRKSDKEDAPETGERRRLTLWDLWIALACITGTVLVLKFFGRLVP